jgi:hypothetical protein
VISEILSKIEVHGIGNLSNVSKKRSEFFFRRNFSGWHKQNPTIYQFLNAVPIVQVPSSVFSENIARAREKVIMKNMYGIDEISFPVTDKQEIPAIHLYNTIYVAEIQPNISE